MAGVYVIGIGRQGMGGLLRFIFNVVGFYSLQVIGVLLIVLFVTIIEKIPAGLERELVLAAIMSLIILWVWNNVSVYLRFHDWKER